MQSLKLARRGVLMIALATAASTAWAQDKTTSLFKIITVKDEIIIGLNAAELDAIGGPILRGAARHGLDVPVTRSLIAAVERRVAERRVVA